MMRTLTAALAVALSAVAAPAMAVEPTAPAAPVDAIVRHQDGGWAVDLMLDRDAPVWVFVDSETVADGRGWRLDQWRVETPGVSLETVNGRDLLRAESGGSLPRRVRLRMEPRFVDLQHSYDPVLTFSNGAVAWFSESFNLVPVASAAELADLPRDLDPRAEALGWTRVVWSDAAGPVLFKGERRAEPAEARAGTYVLFGPAEVTAAGTLATVVDPGLPVWVSQELADYSPRVADVYARRLGEGANEGAAVMMSWGGPTAGATSMAGSVLPRLIVMAFEGDGVLEPSTGVRDLARWFIGHESAHFWLGQTVGYETPADSWITEGGADLMAVRALQAVDPAYVGAAELQKSVDDCVALADQPVVSSADRGEFRAHYACGGVFALVAEAAQRRATGGDWFDFLRPLIDASRDDQVVTRGEWLDALDEVSGDPSLRRDIEALLDTGAPDAASTVAGLLEGAGVPVRREGRRVVLTAA